MREAADAVYPSGRRSTETVDIALINYNLKDDDNNLIKCYYKYGNCLCAASRRIRVG